MAARSDGARHVYLVRHGQTALNAEGRLRGLSNPPLDETGVAEARNLAVVLATKRPSLVVSSPLERAVDTARVIAEVAGAARWVDEHFNDRDYGPQTGQLKAEVIARWERLMTHPALSRPRTFSPVPARPLMRSLTMPREGP